MKEEKMSTIFTVSAFSTYKEGETIVLFSKKYIVLSVGEIYKEFGDSGDEDDYFLVKDIMVSSLE